MPLTALRPAWHFRLLPLAVHLAVDRVAEWQKRHLAVTHGIFSNNAVEKLSEKYEVIYSTNSYDPDLTLDCGFVQDVWE